MSPSSPACPRCRVPLSPVHAGGEVAGVCSRCGGTWLGVSAMGKVVSRAQTDLVGATHAAAARTGAAVDLSAAGIPCPECAGPMRQVHVPNTDVLVDRCEVPHGTWFDKDELARMAHQLGRARAAAPLHPATAAAGAGVLAAGIGAAALAQAAPPPGSPQRELAMEVAEEAVEVAADVALDVALDGGLETGVELAGAAAEVGAEALGAAAEAGSGVLEVVGSLLSGIFEGLGSL